jgi:hypothetical protein
MTDRLAPDRRLFENFTLWALDRREQRLIVIAIRFVE